MMRAVRLTACSALILAAACGPKPRPIAMRDLQGNDVGVCYRSASIGAPNLHGDATLMLYVDADGAIPAAWFHDSGTLDYPQFFKCITSFALDTKIEASPVDHIFGWVFNCSNGHEGTGDDARPAGCAIHPLNTLPPAPLNEDLAQSTLAFSDWADSTDKGWGYYYAHKYSDAQATFQAVLDATPDDARAERGLAQTLVESGGDLKKARELAEKAVAAKKNAASLEALVRVCLKLGDDDCAVKNFVEATKAEDVKYRSLDLAQLNDIVKAANERLAAKDKKREADEAAAQAALVAERDAKLAKEDPLGCYKLTGAEQARCDVKRCFEAGAQAYAKELSRASGTAYAAGEIVAKAEGGSTVVTIELRPAKGSKKKPDTTRDASWTLDASNAVMKATTASAAAIAKDHNACK